MIRLTELFEDMKLSNFAEKRLKGAAKIAMDAKEKGGPAILTYEHFAVKLSHYKQASEGKFDIQKAQSDYKIYMEQLHELMNEEKPDAVEFQKLVGLLEVLGELIIKSKTETAIKEDKQRNINRKGGALSLKTLI